jgi:CTP synthase
VLVPDTRAARAYASAEISERHRHRYEFNPEYRKEFVQSGMRIAGTSPDGTLVEIVELAAHPWFVAVQYHPEFKSKPNIPHPLFRDFVQACLQRRLGRAVAISAPGDSIRAQG